MIEKLKTKIKEAKIDLKNKKEVASPVLESVNLKPNLESTKKSGFMGKMLSPSFLDKDFDNIKTQRRASHRVNVPNSSNFKIL